MAPPEPEPRPRHEKRQMILNFFLAFVGIIWAVVFGIFSILAWKSSEKANKISELANLIALADMCDDRVANIESVCCRSSDSFPSSTAGKVNMMHYIPRNFLHTNLLLF